MEREEGIMQMKKVLVEEGEELMECVLMGGMVEVVVGLMVVEEVEGGLEVKGDTVMERKLLGEMVLVVVGVIVGVIVVVMVVVTMTAVVEVMMRGAVLYMMIG